MKAITIVIVALTIGACASVDKMIVTGNFDAAISKSSRKISGKDKLKRKHVVALEEAFAKATQRDIARVKSLSSSEDSRDWRETISIYDKMARRQERLRSLLPIRAKDGYKATFSFVKVAELRSDAVDTYSHWLYTEASAMLERAEAGQDKPLYRKVHQHLDDLWAFHTEYKEARSLQREAREKGISHVRVRAEDQTGADLPDAMIDQLLLDQFRDRTWVHFHFASRAQVDHEVSVVLEEVAVSPEHIRERRFGESKKIEDGFEYVLDDRGNVMKDSLGNDIKQPLIKKIRARVREFQQHKSAWLNGHVVWLDVRSERVEHQPFDAEVVFEHRTATFRGDERALQPQTRRLLDAGPLPFPRDEQMIHDLIASLGEIITKKVDYRDFL